MKKAKHAAGNGTILRLTGQMGGRMVQRSSEIVDFISDFFGIGTSLGWDFRNSVSKSQHAPEAIG